MGTSRLQRPYFYCRRCRVDYAPFYAALGLAPERKQSDVQEEAIRLALEMPYGDAEAFLARLTDARLSDCAIHEVVDRFGGSLDVLDVALAPFPDCKPSGRILKVVRNFFGLHLSFSEGILQSRHFPLPSC